VRSCVNALPERPNREAPMRTMATSSLMRAITLAPVERSPKNVVRPFVRRAAPRTALWELARSRVALPAAIARPPTQALGQFLMSPEGQIRISLDSPLSGSFGRIDEERARTTAPSSRAGVMAM